MQIVLQVYAVETKERCMEKNIYLITFVCASWSLMAVLYIYILLCIYNLPLKKCYVILTFHVKKPEI